MKKEFFKKIKKLISKGLLEDAIKSLLELVNYNLSNKPPNSSMKEVESELIIYSSQWSGVKKTERLGTENSNHVKMDKTKVSKSLLELSNILEEQELIFPNNKKMETVILNSSAKSSKMSKLKQSKTKNKSSQSVDTITTETSPKIAVELTIDKDFSSYSEKDQESLINAITSLLNLENSIVIKKMRKGSVIVTIEVTKEQAEQLKKLIDEGELKEQNIKKVDIDPDKGNGGGSGGSGSYRSSYNYNRNSAYSNRNSKSKYNRGGYKK